MNNKIVLWLLVAVTTAVLPGMTAAVSPSDTLVFANSFQADSLDPVRIPNDTKFYMTLIFDSLVGTTLEGQISKETGIARDWQMSADGKVWTFHLRRGIKFHNGDELTAEDVKFSLERFVSPYSISSFSSSLRATIEKVETLDMYTVKVYCKKPSPLFAFDVSDAISTEGYIFPKKYIEGISAEDFGQRPIGSGPYKVIEVVGGYHIKLEAAFEKHWLLGPLKFKNILLRYVPEEIVRIAMAENKEADIVPVGLDQVSKLRSKGFTIVQDPGNGVVFIALHEQWNDNHPVSKKKVRQALALAIDSQSIFEHLYSSFGRLVGNCNAIKGSIGYVDYPPYPYDPEKSKKLLEEAGYPNGFKLKIHSYPTGAFPFLQPFLEIIADSFEKIGVKSEIIPYANYSSFRAKYVAHETENGLAGKKSGGRANPLKSTHLWWHKDSMLRLIEDPEVSKMIDMANASLDQNERIRLIKKISKQLYDDYRATWSMEVVTPYIISDKLEPWDMGYVPLDINLRDAVKLK